MVGRNFLTSSLLIRLVCFVGRLNQVTNLYWPCIWLGLFQDKKRFGKGREDFGNLMSNVEVFALEIGLKVGNYHCLVA